MASYVPAPPIETIGNPSSGIVFKSLQNISYAMRELEEQGLVKCITPDKHTWKKYIPTERGTEVYLYLKKNDLLGN